ncbi:hypothetical protein [Pseudomonas cremoricolorata]|uniref:hypothetical protein n=1 Tax=Pseudomonas cremoricolorata TaxID=157783 RepID=UPI00048CAA1A|nr:hypothetical protein [Pseudomonas cremoricolorata]
MQPRQEELKRPDIHLRGEPGDYTIRGFSELYSIYLKNGQSASYYFAWALCGVGVVVGLLGVYALIVRPSEIRYLVSTGPSLFQYIQAYAMHLTWMGCALFGISTSLLSVYATVDPETFLGAAYNLITADGQAAAGKVQIEYLGGDTFSITPITEEASPPTPAS